MAQVHVRLNADTHDKLKEVAKENNISLNQLISNIADDYINHSGGSRANDDVLLSRIIKLEQTNAEMLKYVIHTNVVVSSFIKALESSQP